MDMHVSIPRAVLLGAMMLAATSAAAQSSRASSAWSGAYLGVFGVGGSTQVHGVSRRGDGSFGSNANDESADDAFRGAGAGLLLGYRHQYGNGIVVGLETDLSGLRQEGREDTLVSAANAWNGMTQASIVRETPWLSTARVRLGYALGPVLLDVTGGVAVASIVETRTQYEGLNGPSRTVARFSETDRAYPVGWTVGLGALWRMSDAWALRMDYLRARFDDVSLAFSDARGGVVTGSGFASVQGRSINNDVQIDMVRIGVTYSFGTSR